MRRLPIYFLIDVSESMVGEPIKQVQEGIQSIVKELRADPYALETVHISVILFAGKVLKLTSMEELYNFNLPNIPIGGGTSLGKAIDFLMTDLDNSLHRTTEYKKGDWKPIIFLFTDGNPTDYIQSKSIFEKWNSQYKKSSNLVAIAIGNNMETKILKELSDNVLQLKSTDEYSFTQFFKWITASIKATSMSIGSGESGDDLKLAPISDDDLLSKIELEMSVPEVIDEYFAVLLAKCTNSKKHYLIKYEREINDHPYSNFVSNHKNTAHTHYTLVGAYPISNEYFQLTDEMPIGSTVNTSKLNGFPSCPCCGNNYGFALCSCNRIICIGEENHIVCPWCDKVGTFTNSGGESDINRTRG